MLYLILSIVCSVSVGIIFKIARRSEITVTQIVAWNYVFALIFCYLFFKPDTAAVTASAPWVIYGVLALLMPSVFLFLASSIKHMGIVKTDAAQRLSLFIPILAAWLLFGEQFTTYKIAGLLVGFPAIVLIFSRKDATSGSKWQYPAIVLLGFGIVDILFKKIATHPASIPFTTSLFIIFSGALLIATLIVAWQIIVKKHVFRLINIAYGVLVGIFNFGNILFYLLAHREFADNPSTVFATMNMGVIVLGSLTGVLLFKEKLSLLNYLGIAMALVAIAFITLSQIYM